MKQQPSPLWTTGTSEVRLTGTWRSAVPDYRTAPSPCHGACPVDGRIAQWIRQVQVNDCYGAWLTLVENNPFPAVAGRICHHPCESVCNRAQLDDAIGICDLERFVGDQALQEGWRLPQPAADKDLSVAVVGGGPAGLSAAYQLRRRGYRVHIFESRQQLGGLMRYGIPAYRLDKKILDGEIRRIIGLGVQTYLGMEIADGEQLEALSSEHDAVYLASGATRSKALPNLDYSQTWVMDSAEFLAVTHSDRACDLGDALVVIGGGSAAMDVARSARRLGKSVTVLSLEPEALLPAQREEVEEALEEGVQFITGAMMQSVVPADDGLILRCVRVDFQPGDTGAAFQVEAKTGSEFQLQAQALIPSIGQDADIERWRGLLASDATVIGVDRRWRTNAPGVFAGGDVASLDRFVTQAVGMGKQAAAEIERYLESERRTLGSVPEPVVRFSAINTDYYPLSNRRKTHNVDVRTRLQDFAEVQSALTGEDATAESARCFSCGACIYCDNCYFYCPDMAIIKLEQGYEIKTDYCKGCGLCVAECPTGSIAMRDESQGQHP